MGIFSKKKTKDDDKKEEVKAEPKKALVDGAKKENKKEEEKPSMKELYGDAKPATKKIPDLIAINISILFLF